MSKRTPCPKAGMQRIATANAKRIDFFILLAQDVCVMLAAAILISTVLYLVDRNHAWKKFKEVSTWVTVIAIIGMGYLEYNDYRTSQIYECSNKVRAAYPTAYADLDSLTLGKKMLEKYPSCDVTASVSPAVKTSAR